MTNTNDHDDIFIEPEADAEVVPRDAEKKIRAQKAEIERLEKERKEYLDGWQRAKAEFINYKKDEWKRLEDVIRFSSAGLVEDILPVLDSFDLALAGGIGKEAERGILLIRSQMEDILKKRGVTQIAVQPGDPFNPEKHESISEMESPHPAGAIAEVSQKGYELAGRVIRPARVKLSKGRNEEPR